VLLVAAGIPRLVLAAAGGAALGFWSGLLVVQIGSILGHYAVFLIVRWGGRDFVLQRWPTLSRVADFIHDRGIVGVLLARQLPLHGMLVNLGLGLSRVTHRDFLLGTAIGILPEAIPVTLAAAGLINAPAQHTARFFVVGTIVVAILWIGGGTVLGRIRHLQKGAIDATD
jgi:uncharacterized membrane protein YdjX (TVP38/TMEM64 family)